MDAPITGQGTLGKDEFLRLLVTRLANQDPLSPMDDQDFIAQMAQFSSLEQLANMNENLERALTGDGLLSKTITNTLATTLIGKDVRVQTSTAVIKESGGTDIRFDLDRAAADVSVEILDSAGTMVRALRPGGGPAGENRVAWDGLDANGTQLPAGAYHLRIRATDEKGETVGVRAYFRGTVSGIRYVEGDAFLMIGSGLIPISDVLEVLAGGEEDS